MTAYEIRISDWSSDVCSSVLSACMDASSASTLSTLPLSSFIAGPRLPARSSRYLGDELFVFSARAERNLVEVGKSYMKGMAEAALHQRARLLLLRGRERRRNHHPLLDFVQAALDELEPPNLWLDRQLG